MANGVLSTVERVDDIPLLLAQMKKIQLASLLDKHFPVHGHWKGLGLGHIVEVWLAYILSEGDHRLNHVESWAEGLLITLETCLASPVRSLDFTDDRLAIIERIIVAQVMRLNDKVIHTFIERKHVIGCWSLAPFI